MKINNCRNCNSKKLSKLFSLGKMSFTGKFAKSLKANIPKAIISLKMCNTCKLVQLDRNFNPKYLSNVLKIVLLVCNYKKFNKASWKSR